MKTPYRPIGLALAWLSLSACRPAPPPTERPPEPQATQLRDAIQAPLDKAKAVQDTLQQAADDRAKQTETAEESANVDTAP